MKTELKYGEMIESFQGICEKSPFIRLSYFGKSILGKPLPLITVGDESAKKSVLYVATHHASENITTSLLLDFISEYAELYEKRRDVFGINLKFLCKMRKIYVVPMLNPDGVSYRLEGIDDKNPLKERIIKANGSSDFSKWNSNARGVDLNHNYNALFYEYKGIERSQGIIEGASKYSGEEPESEPEVSSLCKLIRYNSDTLVGILTLHTQGEEIYYKSNGKSAPRSEFIAKILSQMTGYSLGEAEGTASYGGLTDWFIEEFNKPSFTLECGKGENPLSMSEERAIYAKIRKALFNFPILF